MLLAFIVYISLLIISLFLSNKSRKYRNNSFIILCLVSIIISSIVLGLRENVGVDFYVYKNSYIEGVDWYEPGYVLLQQTLRGLNLHYSALFIAIAYLQLYYYYKFFWDKKYLLPYAIFFFFTYGQLFTDLNIIRQGVAISIILYSTQFIYRSNLKKFVIYILLATSFHSTSIIYLLLYFIKFVKLRFLKSVFWQLLLYAISLALAAMFQKILSEYISNNKFSIELLARYASIGVDKFQVTSGVGVILMRVVDFLIIIAYPLLRKKFDERFDLYYKIFFIGIFLYNIVGIHMLFSRVFGGLVIMRLAILSYLSYYCFNYWKICNYKYKFISCFILIINVLLFFAAIIKSNNQCSPFQFVNL